MKNIRYNFWVFEYPQRWRDILDNFSISLIDKTVKILVVIHLIFLEILSK